MLCGEAGGIDVFGACACALGNEACLTEEESLDGLDIVVMVEHAREGRGDGEALEGVAVGVEAEGAGEGDIYGLAPIVVETADEFFYAVGLGVEALEAEGCDPVGEVDGGEGADFVGAGEAGGGVVYHPAVGLVEVACAGHHYLQNGCAVGSHDGAIVGVDDVEHNITVCRVGVVTVAVPVGGKHVYLYIAGPDFSAYTYFGVEEIGSGVVVEQAGVDNFQRLSVAGAHVARKPQSVLPHILHQLLSGLSAAHIMAFFTRLSLR